MTGTLDFDLEIGLGTGKVYPVTARAPSGEAEASMQFPFALAELDYQLDVINNAVLVSSVIGRRLLTEEEEPVQRLGRRLFNALLSDDVRALYVASLQRARENDAMLRLVLRIRPPELARLPWEFLFDSGQQDYVGLSHPLVRYPHVLAPKQPLQVSAPLRILGMVARPGDQQALEVESEQDRVRAALAGLERDGIVKLSWVGGQTFSHLQDAIDHGPWHVFHFVGHGGYDPARHEGVIALADERGRTDLVTADDLSRMLGEHYPLRLVVLNACDTGRGGALDAFASTAAALIRRGVPAVVAMQFEISDPAAIKFAHIFYQNVAKRLPVDSSVMRARRELRRAKRDTLEWGTPVLYLRAPDGHLFGTLKPDAKQQARREAEEQARRQAEEQARREAEERARREAEERAHREAEEQARREAEERGHGEEPSEATPMQPRLHHPVRQAKHVQTVHQKAAIRAVAFSPDGNWLAIAGDARTARIWDLATGDELLAVRHDRFTMVSGIAFSPDGRRLATAGGDSTARIWDVTNGKELFKIPHDGAVDAMALSPDGRRLATTSRLGNGIVRIWDANTGHQLHEVIPQEPHPFSVSAVAFSPDGRWLATASFNGCNIWDATSGKHLRAITQGLLSGGVLQVSFSPDDRRLLTAGSTPPRLGQRQTRAYAVQIWDATYGTELVKITSDREVHAAVFSPDGHWLATAGSGKMARVWDATGLNELLQIPHDNEVNALAFSPDGRRLATASSDGAARIWALEEVSGGDQA